jgi:hypothetical protein
MVPKSNSFLLQTMPFFSKTNPLAAINVRLRMKIYWMFDFNMGIKKALYAFETIQRL